MENHDVPTLRGWTPILRFHEVLPDGISPLPPNAVTVSTLRAILRDYTARSYISGTLHDALHPHSALVKRLILTFDDGTCDFLEYALPVLQEFNATATLFIVAGAVGGRRTWSLVPDHDQAPVPVPLIGASDLRELADRGFAIGSHTMQHRPLSSLSVTAAAEEIATSRYVLGDLIGRPVEWFAYPYTTATPAARTLVWGAGYTGACSGYNQDHGRFCLNRIDASSFTLPQLRLRSSGLFHWTRQTAHRARRRALLKR